MNYYGLPRANTAPSLVLQAAYGYNQEAAQRIVAAREIQPIYSELDLERVSGMAIAVDPMDMVYFPSDQLRLTLWYNDATRIRQIHLQLTLFADEKSLGKLITSWNYPFLPVMRVLPQTLKPLFSVQRYLQNHHEITWSAVGAGDENGSWHVDCCHYRV
ncbi:MAG: hypothetical protein R3E08_01035 [Thiotrichaceae bacterium]